MLIKVNGNLLAVNFQHKVEDAVKSNGHKNRNAGRRYTTCIIKLQRFIDEWKDSRGRRHDTTISFFDEVASGKSTCSLGDKFNKNIGRAVSFARAIESSTNEFIKNNSEDINREFCKIENIAEITDVTFKKSEPFNAQMHVSTSNQKVVGIDKFPPDSDTIDLGKATTENARIHPVKILPENIKVDVIIHP